MKATWKPSWVIEAREPAFIGPDEEGSTIKMTSHGTQKYLWGNVPAIDVVNLQRNEGVDFAADLHLLFAGGYSFLIFHQSLTPV